MRAPNSLQGRLGLALALAVTAMWLVATVGSGLIVRHELDEAFDSALQEAAQRLLPLTVADVMEREPGAQAARVDSLHAHREYITYIVRDRDGRLLLQSHDADPAHFPEKPAVWFRTTPTHRIYGEAAVSGTIILEVAEPLQHRREAALESALGLLAPLPFVMTLSLIGVWLLVRRSMRPVHTLRGEIELRGNGNLQPVSARKLPTEIAPIADAVNRLMDRLRRAIESERSFTANSAHELRTPIAATLAQTQRLVAEAPEGPVRERARSIEASLRRIARLAEKLMDLARAEGGGLTAEEPQDLVPVLRHVLEEMRRSPGAGDRIRGPAPSGRPLVSRLDADAFAVLVRNLVENALHHGPAGGPVEVFLPEDGVLSIVNGGPPVPPDTRAGLKARFVRGATDAEGSGLGLAIADTIAQAGGGALRLLSPASGRPDGFEARLTLPVEGQSPRR
ncbi:ATP-binding protein [Futiania mangrovi]|uniref:histidine kinase n=1 Tax=Futiania mangrovi TaxID=2959716 RepID=A0A9J6PBZ0_9PROT|nr:ATP-binding protein [Futiania mangrovii]MCP1335115.1 ATP-binding protein [Futiania mangrovii]